MQKFDSGIDKLNSLEEVVIFLANNPEYHFGAQYRILDIKVKNLIKNQSWGSGVLFENFVFPNIKLGKVQSHELLELRELILFSYYLSNMKEFKSSIDLGANVGLHSIMMSRLGWKVIAFEPDPVHIEIMKENLTQNKCKNVSIAEKAVSNKSGYVNFVRVLDNTTSNHISGYKQPYGKVEIIQVPSIDFDQILSEGNLIKIDIEGTEGDLLLNSKHSEWNHIDLIVEITNMENASKIFEFAKKNKLNIFSQKNAWEKATSELELPNNYKEGSVIIKKSDNLSWST